MAAIPANIIIRPAQPADIPTIVEFNRALARETENRDLNAKTLRSGVERLLMEPAKGVYYIAEINGEIAGSDYRLRNDELRAADRQSRE